MARYVKVLTSDQATPKVAGVPAEWTDVEDLTGVQPKRYVALLTQSGTSAPVATVLENTLGGEIVWSRDDAGVYLATLGNAFPQNKTVILASPSLQEASASIYAKWQSVNAISVQTLISGTPLDEELGSETGFQIIVYP